MAKGAFSYKPGLPFYEGFFDGEEGSQWQGQLRRDDNSIVVSEAASILSYGQSIFEGLKAFRGADQKIRLFRPDMNATRFQISAKMIGLPVVDKDFFMNAVTEVVNANLDQVPAMGEGSLYIRPIEFADQAMLGLDLSKSARFITYVAPVGDYFSGKAPGGLKLCYCGLPRVAANGMGEAKAATNYAPSLVMRRGFQAKGYHDIVFCNSRNSDIIGEATGANAFALMPDGSVVTPNLDGDILAGITRDSVIHLLREEMGLRVEERPLAFTEIMEKAEELFFTGTAWVVAPVEHFEMDNGKVRTFSQFETAQKLNQRLNDIRTARAEDVHGWMVEL